MPGNVLLFHVLRQSTIGAEGLDFRVRNGIGYYPFAIITRLIGYIFIKVFCKQLNYHLETYKKLVILLGVIKNVLSNELLPNILVSHKAVGLYPV